MKRIILALIMLLAAMPARADEPQKSCDLIFQESDKCKPQSSEHCQRLADRAYNCLDNPTGDRRACIVEFTRDSDEDSYPQVEKGHRAEAYFQETDDPGNVTITRCCEVPVSMVRFIRNCQKVRRAILNNLQKEGGPSRKAAKSGRGSNSR